MDRANRYVIQRFLLKTAILTLFAVAQWRHGVAATLGVLFGMASMIDIGLALFGKTPLRRSRLTYWDEAVAFLLLSSVATAVAMR
mgnify:CR=1 FL=1